MSDNQIHVLPTKWSYWASELVKGKNNDKFDIELIGDFDTIQDFWQFFSQFPKYSEMQHGFVSLFRHGIQPVWEDEKNKKRTDVLIRRNITDEFWEEINIKVASGELDHYIPEPVLSGLICKFMNKRASLTLWFQEGDLDAEKLAEVLHVDVSELSIRKI